MTLENMIQPASIYTILEVFGTTFADIKIVLARQGILHGLTTFNPIYGEVIILGPFGLVVKRNTDETS
jgi:hypothetical protein